MTGGMQTTKPEKGIKHTSNVPYTNNQRPLQA
jgi:hypothetical protein